MSEWVVRGMLKGPVTASADLLLTDGRANAADQAHATGENRQCHDGALAQIESLHIVQVRDPPKELANPVPYYIGSDVDLQPANHECLSATT